LAWIPLSTRWDAVDQDVDDLRRSQIVKEEMHRWVEDIMRSWEEGEGFRRRRRTSWEKKEEGRSGSGVGEEVGIEGCRYGLQTQWAMTSCCYYLLQGGAKITIAALHRKDLMGTIQRVLRRYGTIIKLYGPEDDERKA
jgi:hypothetical protein